MFSILVDLLSFDFLSALRFFIVARITSKFTYFHRFNRSIAGNPKRLNDSRKLFTNWTIFHRKELINIVILSSSTLSTHCSNRPKVPQRNQNIYRFYLFLRALFAFVLSFFPCDDVIRYVDYSGTWRVSIYNFLDWICVRVVCRYRRQSNKVVDWLMANEKNGGRRSRKYFKSCAMCNQFACHIFFHNKYVPCTRRRRSCCGIYTIARWRWMRWMW